MRVGIVSIYPPPRSKHVKRSGVAAYSKNLVDSLLKYCSVVVFADKIGQISDYESSKGLQVHRCWNRGVTYPFQIFKKLLNEKVDVVHIQHETYLYGGLASLLVFPLLLFLVRLLGKPAIVTMHGVIPLSRVDECFLEENRINGNPLIMRIGLTLIVKIIVPFSTMVVVHENKLRDVLVKEYKCRPSKICVIYHGIEEPEVLVESTVAKTKLGFASKNVILFLGYITGYKNVDLLIDSAKYLKGNGWVMMIAGGVHPRLANDPGYQKYLSDLQKKASTISKEKIVFKGFVPEEALPDFLAAADLVVFPHNICISSSGPLSIAASYCRPFLVSNSFREIIDFDCIVFENNPKELAHKIDCFFTDATFNLTTVECLERFRNSRLWSKVAKQTYELYKVLLNEKSKF